MRISVLGTGHLGASHAACLALVGHHVTGVDRDPSEVAMLREDGLDDLLGQGLRCGRLRSTADPREAADADAHFVCVPDKQRWERAGWQHGCDGVEPVDAAVRDGLQAVPA